ncbi:hypothetical protein Krad_4375 [Kineococcus radiotolerans SRS30216 = ATCC BAA-149]|uniref:Uncharacterized protein n=2 Tax=Kineococcus radiotolerans TaxID=131568 RepID=A6WG99_KINRD|nr:hypothetical protein Krad_4375 [Kineococcus radiotolerans SRS30216 = ATCC BAA-149]
MKVKAHHPRPTLLLLANPRPQRLHRRDGEEHLASFGKASRVSETAGCVEEHARQRRTAAIADAVLVRFHLDTSATAVEAWSEARLQFEPRGWQVEYRQSLREAIADLDPRAAHGLLAEYLTPDDVFVDVENVLLYNVGTAVFAPVVAVGITCRQGRAPDDRHHVRYRVVESPLAPGGGALIGQVAADLGTGVPKTAGRWWAALRESAVTPQPFRQSAGSDAAFTVDVVLTSPTPARVRLPGLLKPLLDGLISCFHAHDSTNAALLPKRLAAHGLPEHAWDLLVDSATSGLGTRPLVRPYRDGIAWNPADDRCDAFRVVLQAGSPWSIAAELREHVPEAAAPTPW